jgi:predicted alpha/beta hydrolase family esterase
VTDHGPVADGGLSVRGGVGGTAVGLADLDAAARRLADCAGRLTLVSARFAALVADPAPVVTAPLSPGTAALAAAAAARAAGPGGLAGEVLALSGLATATAGGVAGYRAAEAALVVGVDAARDTVMGLVGRCLPEVAVGVLALGALGVDVVGTLDRVVVAHPEVVELSGGLDGLAAGLRADPRLGWLLGPGWSARAGEDRSARTDSYETALGVLAGSARAWGLLRDGGIPVAGREPVPRGEARAPRDLADVARDLSVVGDGRSYPGHVRVVEVAGESGAAWVVEVSGTQDWDPRADDAVLDVTSDVQLMAGASSVLAETVGSALDQARAESGRSGADDPVMLVGHSLGGITAAALASSPAFTARHRVTHVVTMGSPVARMPVPASVSVLSLEHGQDPVPRLDGRANPDRSSWVTVRRDPVLPSGSGAGVAHAVGGYAATAAATDQSGDPSVEAWRRGSAAFFRGEQHGAVVVRDYRVQRAPPP